VLVEVADDSGCEKEKSGRFSRILREMFTVQNLPPGFWTAGQEGATSDLAHNGSGADQDRLTGADWFRLPKEWQLSGPVILRWCTLAHCAAKN
jgi:hypothetical protein